MSPETLSLLLYSSICLVSICLMGVIFSGMVGGSALIISQIFRIHKKVGEDLANDERTYFGYIVPNLLPWGPEALADFSSQVRHSGRAALGNVHYRGTVQSLSQPESGWLAFDLQLKRSKGPMHLNTTRHTLRLDFGGIGSRTVQVEVDDWPFGAIRDDPGIVSLFDSLGRPAGLYHQHMLALGIPPAEYNLKPYYGSVEIGGRTLAELNRNPLMKKQLLGKPTIPPLFQQLAPDLTLDEELWLLALVGWEICNRVYIAV